MGTIRYTAPDPDGESHGLQEHEGLRGQIFEDDSLHGGGDVSEVGRRTMAWRGACGCGWLGETVLPRPEGASAWTQWEDVPELEREWTAHSDPLLEALAREHGVVTAEEVTEALAPVRVATEQAGALVATALRACDELERAGSGGHELEEIRRYLIDAGRAIGRAEVLSYPVRQVVGPLVLERIESQETTGWARWEVRDQAGALVGLVVEDREWVGHAYGPVSFTLTDNPSARRSARCGGLRATRRHVGPWPHWWSICSAGRRCKRVDRQASLISLGDLSGFEVSQHSVLYERCHVSESFDWQSDRAPSSERTQRVIAPEHAVQSACDQVSIPVC